MIAASSLRLAARSLRRNPRLSLPVLALLSLAIGASGAAYSAVYSILLRPLPYRDATCIALLLLLGAVSAYLPVRRALRVSPRADLLDT